MSINRDMRIYALQKKENVRTDSGAEKVTWIDTGTITAAIRKKDELRMVANERYRESTHTGLTHRKDIRAFQFRILDGGIIYEIIDCNPEGRLSNLLLKVVDGNV
ncbi:phage head-tail adapter protein [Lachnospiraceae bacterium ASD3451]|nr:phage head-tail adapter protein [Diplocloster agilis]